MPIHRPRANSQCALSWLSVSSIQFLCSHALGVESEGVPIPALRHNDIDRAKIVNRSFRRFTLPSNTRLAGWRMNTNIYKFHVVLKHHLYTIAAWLNYEFVWSGYPLSTDQHGYQIAHILWFLILLSARLNWWSAGQDLRIWEWLVCCIL